MSEQSRPPTRALPDGSPAYRRAGRVRRVRVRLERAGAEPLEHEVADPHSPRAWLDDLAHQLMEGDARPGDRLTITLLSREQQEAQP